MVKCVALLAALCAGPALADGGASMVAGVAGRGSVRLLPGWHLSWDDPLVANAAATGVSLSYPQEGGPAGFFSFSWGATEDVEVAVDLYGSWQRLPVQGGAPLDRYGYGVLLGGRWVGQLGTGGNLEAYLHLAAGPVLGNLSGHNDTMVAGEGLTTGFLGGLGLAWNVAEPWAVSLEYRCLYARTHVPSPVDGTLNAGGHFLLLGVAWHTAGQPARHSFVEGP